jgi:predicted transcriptional regulator of viral defense system
LFNIHDLPTNHRILTSAELRGAGAQHRDIVELLEGGVLYRIAPGLYADADICADPELDDALACHRTGGVIGLLSACQRHGICDAVPQRIQILLPHSKTSRVPRGLPADVIRIRDPRSLTVGIDSRPFDRLEIRITNPARTVVDLYRMDPKAWRQHALASMTRFVRDGGDVEELYEIAETFGATDIVRPEVEAVQELLEQGMRP